MSNPYPVRYYCYTVPAAALSCAFLGWMTPQPAELTGAGWLPLVGFTTLALLSKFLSFRMMRVVTLSMDTAVYVTALLCLGTVPAAWAVFLSSFAKMIWDSVVREWYRGGEKRPWLENVSSPLFQGGTAALALLCAGSLLPVDEFVAGELSPALHVTWMAPSLAAIFLVLQYTIVLNKYWLRGYSWRNLLREVFLPGVVAEMLLIPLTMIMTLAWRGGAEDAAAALLVMVVAYVVVNILFKRHSDAAAQLDARVKDLEALNELGRTLCSTLQAADLVPALAFQTRTLLPGADAALVFAWDDEKREFTSNADFSDGFLAERFDARLAARLSDWVVRSKMPFLVSPKGEGRVGLSLSHLDGQPLSGESWAAVPVQVYEQIIGVLLVYSREPGVFSDADLGLLQMVGLQAAVALQNSRLYVLATVDGLTRLFVRRYFDRRLAEEVARSRRYKTHFSLMLLDFDNFKGINDRYGHAVGDQVLRRAGDILLTEVRTMDIPCRYGGDELAVILPEADVSGAAVLGQRILRRIREETIPVGEESVSFRMSIGVAGFPAHADQDAAQIITRADEALYHVKHSGKGRLAIYGEWDEGPVPAQ